MNKLLTFALFLTLMLSSAPTVALDKKANKVSYSFITKVKQKPHAFSPNVVFVVDASSSINRSKDISAKFNKAWDKVISKVASDQLYVKVYIFRDKNKFIYSKWMNMGGPLRYVKPKWDQAKTWVKKNTGTYSYGCQAIRHALTRINPHDKNPATRSTLTMILITDGGFTEAAKYIPKAKKITFRNYYTPVYRAIHGAQKWRKANDLAMASICTVGLNNREIWSNKVKRPNSECQAFLQDIGSRYGGGYYLVRKNTTKKKKLHVSVRRRQR